MIVVQGRSFNALKPNNYALLPTTAGAFLYYALCLIFSSSVQLFDYLRQEFASTAMSTMGVRKSAVVAALALLANNAAAWDWSAVFSKKAEDKTVHLRHLKASSRKYVCLSCV